MRFATFDYDGKEQLGVLTWDGTGIVSLEPILPGLDLAGLASAWGPELRERLSSYGVRGTPLPLSIVRLEAPIPHPPRGIICLGKNYRDHVREVAKEIDSQDQLPSRPIYFSKLTDRCVGPDGIIPAHRELTSSLDYEVELALVIGKGGRDIRPEEAWEHVFGVTILNDVSVRDAQREHVQWLRGKSFDGTCPMGPWVVTLEELPPPLELEIRCLVNGELRQSSNTRELIFDVPTILGDFSRGLTLMPGDVIATGTPAGVGMGFHPPRYLKTGDVVECSIEGIGVLRNRVL